MNKFIKVILSMVMVFAYILSTGLVNSQTAYANDEYDHYHEYYDEYDHEYVEGCEVWQEQADEFYAVIEEVDEQWVPLDGNLESVEVLASAIETVEVSTWNELRDAMSDVSVDHITLSNSITRTGSSTIENHLPMISRDLTIDGNGYTLNFGRNTGRSFRLARRGVETTFVIQNLRVEAIGNSYFILHDDTTATATHLGANTGNWIVHLHDVYHVEDRIAAGLIKAQSSELILTGNIRWNTNSTINSTAAASTAGMIVVRGLTITNGATANLRALHTVINVNPSNRQFETFVTIDEGSVVDLYSQNGQTIWMNRNLAATARNNPVSFTVTGEGTVLNARSDGTGTVGGVIVISGSGPRPSEEFEGYSTAVRIADGAHVFVESVRRVGSGDRAIPALIVQVYRGVTSIRDRGTRVELISNGGDNTTGATLVFRRVGNQVLHINQAELIVTRRRSVSRAAAVRFDGPNNAFNAMNAANVSIRNMGSGARQNTSNQAIQFTSNGAMYFWGGDLLSSTPTTVNITADFGPAITNAGSFQTLAMMARDLATVTISGNTSTATAGAINGRILSILLENVTDFDVVNRRPGGGKAFNADDFSGLSVLNSTVSLWRSGTNLSGNAAQVWPRVDFLLFGNDFRTIEMTSYPRLTQAALGSTGMRPFARFHATVRGVRLDNSELVDQINRITSTQALGGPIGNPYRNNFASDSWDEMIRVRIAVDSLLVRHNPYLSRLALMTATNDIRTATDNLADLRPLRAEIAESVSARDEGRSANVSEMRWNEFTQVLAEAQALVGNPAATRVELEALTARLNTARLQLVPFEVGEVLQINGFNWVVLTLDEDYNALVVTQRIVGRSRGGATSTIAYNGSPLDIAMTNFYNRLSEETRAMIQPVNLPNEVIRFNSTNRWPSAVSGGLSYVDLSGDSRVFALSVAELHTYLGSRMTGAATTNNGNVRTRALPNVGFGANPTADQIWWLRSGGGRANYPMHVEATGVLTSIRARTTEHGLRPAMWIGSGSDLSNSRRNELSAEIEVSTPIRNEGRPANIPPMRWDEFTQAFAEAQVLVENPAATRVELEALTARLNTTRLQLVPFEVGEVLQINGFNWIVLTIDENYNALVVTERIVGRSRGGATSTIAYNGSPLDIAMTNFYNRLSEETRAMIQPAILPTDEGITFNNTNQWPTALTGGGLSYVDYHGENRVFALSANEVRTYITLNARAVRALPNVGFGANPTAAQIWWTRSRGGNASNSTSIEVNGTMMSNRARTTEHGLRPAMWIGTPPAPPASLEAISEQLERIALLNQVDYTTRSWEEMWEVKVLVETTISEVNLGQEAVDELAEMLREAVDNLIDISGLVSEIGVSQNLQAMGQGNYLTPKWQAFLTSIEEAQDLIDRGDATEQEINDAILGLISARDLEVTVGELIEIDGFMWRVLTIDEDHNAMVVADRLVGLSRSGATSTRAYLGSPLDTAMINFYNGLSPETRAMIQTANLPEERVTYTNTILGDWPVSIEGGLSYVDAAGTRTVFAMSYAELQTYLGFVPTGQSTINNGDVRARALPNVGFGANPGNLFFGYWLRSPGSRPTHASSISDLGAGVSTLETVIPERGVRPAMWIR